MAGVHTHRVKFFATGLLLQTQATAGCRVGMKLQNIRFWLGLALAIGVAFYLLSSRNQDVAEPASGSVPGSGAAPSTLSPEERTKRHELVERMMQNNEFRPPPGNVGIHPSAASPFGQVARTGAGDAPLNGGGNPTLQAVMPQIGAMNLGSPNKQNAVAAATRDNLSVPALLQPNTGAPKSSMEFESPPGAGSPKGGQ